VRKHLSEIKTDILDREFDLINISTILEKESSDARFVVYKKK
jgi:hypothetical protein